MTPAQLSVSRYRYARRAKAGNRTWKGTVAMFKSVNSLAVFASFVWLVPTIVSAADGDLDPTFGVGGLVTSDFPGPGTNDYGRDVVAVQADGKIVVVGQTYATGGGDFAVARYNTDGSLDLSFGIGGLVTTDFGSTDVGWSVAIQADGKIVVAGYAYQGGTYDFALARYNSDGSLDTTFDADGLVTTDFGSSSDYAYGVAIQADGKIVVAGRAYSGSPTYDDFALARYNSDGSLDTTFDTDGKLTTDFASSTEYAYGVAIQADGKVVAAGYSSSGGGLANFALVRYNSDGTLDTGFDGDGRLTTDFASSFDLAYDVAIQADGKIVAAGIAHMGATLYDFAVARYNTDGSLDTAFDTDGKVTTDFGSSYYDYAYGVAIQADGKVVVAGYTNVGGGGWNFGLIRYNTDGSLDTGFDTDGRVTTDFASSTDIAWSVAIQADGKIVAAGYAYSGGPTDNDFALARYNSNGSLDTSFDGDGKVTTDFPLPGGTDYGRNLIAVQADGKIVVVGVTHSTGGGDFGVARHNPDGSVDTSFGIGGRVVTDFTSGYDEPWSVAIQADGKIVVAGRSYSGSATRDDFALARYNTDGSLDTAFDGDGKVITDFASSYDYAYGVAIQADGKIVVAGYAYSGGASGYDYALARYNTDGSLDTTFDGDGQVTTDFASSNDFGYGGVAIQADGKIVAAGQSGNNLGLARYNTDGSLDAGFDGDGKLTTFFGYSSSVAYDVAIQGDGKIVAAGHAYQGGTRWDFAMARYNSDGSLDAGLDGDGRVTTDLGGSNLYDYGRSVALQADGKIVLAGFAPWSAGYDFAVVRYAGDGSLDSTFGTAGLVHTDFAGSSDYAYSVAIQADGKIIVAGQTYSGSPTNWDFGIARYLSGSNLAPDCDNGGPYSAQCGGATTAVALDGSGSSDPDAGDTITHLWTTDCPGGSFDDDTSDTPTLTVNTVAPCPLVCNVTLKVTDNHGALSTCVTTVTIADSTPPAITCPGSVSVKCTSDVPAAAGDLAGLVGLGGSASDTCGSVTVTHVGDSSDGLSSPETITRTYRATDACGTTNDCAQTITVTNSATDAELCNGIDDDCDGSVDEDFTDLGSACTNGTGACETSGVMVCKGDETGTECDAVGGTPTAETCNGIDDDCDGSIEEDFTDLGSACTNGTGACEESGVMVCKGDGTGTECNAVAGTPTTETCNGIDDDCDGSVDEDFTDLGSACTNGTGACEESGVMVCKGDETGTECDAVPGTPTAETCNGVDDDCDGSVDEDFTDLGDTCYEGIGACDASGVMVCKGDGTGTECNAVAGTPTAETCNGVDDDCDGSVDEDFTDLGDTCYAGTGACDASGVMVCKGDGTGTECNAVAGTPTAETCNGVDDDCDGSVDEDFTDLGDTCYAGTGACEESGVMVCKADETGTECDAIAGTPTTETCNGIDDDCDGSVDEDFTDLGDTCYEGIGACEESGVMVCKADETGTECDAIPGIPTTETCNGIDDDCDGSIDEDFTDLGDTCYMGIGACEESGVMVCTADESGTECDAVPGTPTTETCNGIDDDCDGDIDEDFTDLGDSCVNGVGACERPGVMVCMADETGTVCDAVPGTPTSETCNGIDDDCDGTVDNNLTSVPAISCPAAVTIECDEPDDPSNTGTATATHDSVPAPTISYTDSSSGTCPTIITRTWTAADSCDVSASCDQFITVRDTTKPELIGTPTDDVVECDSVPAPADVTVVDNCDATVGVTFGEVRTDGLCTGDYTLDRTWTATDNCSNTTDHVQTISVEDTTGPDLTIPQDVAIECDAPTDASNTGVATATDNCDPAPVITFSDDTSGLTGCNGTGIIVRTWTATDDCDNATSDTQTITIQDTTPPELSVEPDDVTVECDSIPTPDVTATDNCDADVPVIFEEERTDGDCPDNYTLTRTWTATDDCDNTTSHTQTITVQDTTPPGLSGVPTEATVECESVPTPATPTADDNCADAPDISFDEVRTDGSCPDEYTLDRTWTATDDCDNSSNELQTITVLDTTAPDITCPLDAAVALPGPTDPSATGIATATDSCDGDPVIIWSDVESAPVQYCPTVTIITRTWRAIDQCDNQGTCDQLIEVTDLPVPSGQCCNPADGTLRQIDDTNDCTEDICNVATGEVTHPNNGLCGACCLPGKECIEDVLVGTCDGFAGIFVGEQSVCLGDTDGDRNDDQCDNCPGVEDEMFGFTICQDDGGECETDADCPVGDSCIPVCQTVIPTVSAWGLIILALLLLTVAKAYFGYRVPLRH